MALQIPHDLDVRVFTVMEVYPDMGFQRVQCLSNRYSLEPEQIPVSLLWFSAVI